jgi:DeoR/GlpR family transcriptional regulator of sugar metabolism
MNEQQIPAPPIRRRRFILRKLEHDGAFTYEDLKDQAKQPANKDGDFPVSPQSVRDDIDYLEQLLRIQVLRVLKDGKTVYLSSTHPNASAVAKAARASLHAESKLAMAYVAGTLILGSRSIAEGQFNVGNTGSAASWKEGLETPDHILHCLQDYPSLRRKVGRYWSQITRRICVDTGTSVDAICENILQHVQLPSPDTVLNHLEVCTNSRRVFSTLGDPDVQTRIIVIGGTQETRTEAICGQLAESFLVNSGLFFGMAFVGATVVDLTEGQFGSDHLRISTTKAHMLGRAQIRIVLADSTKITCEALQSYYPYAALNAASVDIIVTDRGPNQDENYDVENWNILKQSGIAVLYPSERTLAYAAEQIANRERRASRKAAEDEKDSEVAETP